MITYKPLPVRQDTPAERKDKAQAAVTIAYDTGRITKPVMPADKATLAPTRKAMRRRGKVTGVLVGVRLQPEDLALLDAHRGSMSRPEAIRALLELELHRPDRKNLQDSGTGQR